MNPHRREKFLRIIHRRGVVSNFESQMYRRDGSTIWVSESARAVFDERGLMRGRSKSRYGRNQEMM